MTFDECVEVPVDDFISQQVGRRAFAAFELQQQAVAQVGSANTRRVKVADNLQHIVHLSRAHIEPCLESNVVADGDGRSEQVSVVVYVSDNVFGNQERVLVEVTLAELLFEIVD